ncbi:MAG: NAD(P)H-hydrate dehydratase [Solirubrobacteraceae bacterium]|nr:NAD(P)H-hydrate dehydratase [Solirubrobacteraceae bacterium]
MLPGWLAPLLLPEELGASDRYAINERGIPGIDLMERAGGALARAAARALPAGPIAVLCGGGNNGGDGLIAARMLRDGGREVRVLLTRPATDLKGDAVLALRRLGEATPLLGPADAGAVLDGTAGAIDALLGTGATGAPRGAEGALIQALAAAAIPVVACDLPSGIDAATGEVPGAAVRAVTTVTFHRPSPGHLIAPAKDHVGRLEVVDIGIPRGATIEPQIGAIRDAVASALPTRSAASHKYAAGAVVVVAGSAQYPGAAVLAVRGAQRAGAGYVTAVVGEPAVPLVRGSSPEAIVQPSPQPGEEASLDELLAKRADAVVLGPGMSGNEAASLVHAVLAAGVPTVLDADGLAPFAGRPEGLRREAPLILTPHAGELGRLLGRTSAEIGARRLACAREAAQRTGAVVVLKGDDTIVADPNGRVAVNDLSSPALATAGTGDVLAGTIGALLAAGAEPFLAAAGAVRLHAQAGRLAAAAIGAADGVVAFDVAEHLPAARGHH